MCGIAGYYNIDRTATDPSVLKQMLDIQRHRGPDDQRMYLFSLKSGQSREVGGGRAEGIDGGFEGAVGFNRLSIVDLSRRARQPMRNHEGTLLIAFNGEIYNASDYRRKLEAVGFTFRSRADTEVLLHLYEHIGFDAMIEQIEGMFAICIVDMRRGEIHLARDPFGIKPLYWTQQGRTLLFASEVKSFLAHPQFRAEIDVEALDEYLAFRYCAADRFLLRGVHPLEPGRRLRLTMDGMTIQRYWQIPDIPDKLNLDKPSAIEMLDGLLCRSVESHLMGDVAIGCQLSGGIDSSLVAARASRHVRPRLQTFSVIPRQPAYSEERWISQVAQAISIDSHRLLLDESYVLDHLDPATWHLDQPLGMPSTIGVYLLAERAKDLFKVLLSGEGADELFGGYSRFHDAALRERIMPWMPILGRVPRWGHRLARRLKCARTAADAFMMSSLTLSPRRLLELRPEADLEGVLVRRRTIFDQGKADHLSNCMKYDMQTYMVDLLVRQDKMSMAHSIETRVPFLNRQLVSFVRSLPVEYFVRAGILWPRGHSRNTKILLKELARRTFGEAFAYRPKSGFNLPADCYFAHPQFTEIMEEQLLPGMRRRGWLQESAVRRWWRDGGTTRHGVAMMLWVPVALEVWAQLFLDRKITPAGVTRGSCIENRASSI
jgi:asparagine synthase (glutamine-hydrolysing)